ncbi:MAG: ABC transporter substrate-binding protein [Candidatus Accumulibacter sp.]|uniref:ABC transporter substrate-binding protein n=1 Tax=Accumulibacter sp. TaxID=2053492 RepID=UPI001A092015|nr:ABC transporter substrate-binding protein [Accumulibacter sp.]MBE2257302.1 ABC transporter substrate-binding protein [Paracoccaceae bacterium]MCB1941188.1 ABC transporter substrate-binding protein [Accumulibacter sp.]MCP5247850.1 ABC transporter substrate-binding protein [Accumulibacter sp.]
MKQKQSTMKLLALAAGMLTIGAAQADLTVISFGGTNQKAQVKAFYEPFTKETRIAIVQGEYNGEQAKIKAMVDARNVTWDVVEVESPELARGCEEGVYEKLDYSRIGNKKDFLDSAIRECGFGFFVWSTVLAYNADSLKVAPTSWSDFWDLKKFPGKRGMRKGAKFTLEFALMADGVKPAEVYKVLGTKAGVERAFKKLDQIKPHIQWWEAGAQPPQLLASGDVVMSSAYNGRIAAAQQEGRNLKIVWTGNIYDVEFFALPVGVTQRDAAYKFLATVGKADNQKVYSSEIPYGPTNLKAMAQIPAAVAAELPTAPANAKTAVASNTSFWVEHGEDLEQRFNAWAAR